MYVVTPEYDRRWLTLLDAIAPLAEQGVSAVEVSLRNRGYFDYRDLAAVDRTLFELERAGIEVYSVEALCGPACDISSPDDAVHEDGVVALIDAIEFAGVSGAKVVTVRAGSGPAEPNGRRLDRARGVLRETAVLACDASVFVALRNCPLGYITHDPEELLKLVDAVGHDNVGICFDCGCAQQTASFGDAARLLLPLAIAARVYDTTGQGLRPVFPGDGEIAWSEFAAVVGACNRKPEVVFACGPPQDMDWEAAWGQFERMLSVGV